MDAKKHHLWKKNIFQGSTSRCFCEPKTETLGTAHNSFSPCQCHVSKRPYPRAITGRYMKFEDGNSSSNLIIARAENICVIPRYTKQGIRVCLKEVEGIDQFDETSHGPMQIENSITIQTFSRRNNKNMCFSTCNNTSPFCEKLKPLNP